MKNPGKRENCITVKKNRSGQVLEENLMSA